MLKEDLCPLGEFALVLISVSLITCTICVWGCSSPSGVISNHFHTSLFWSSPSGRRKVFAYLISNHPRTPHTLKHLVPCNAHRQLHAVKMPLWQLATQIPPYNVHWGLKNHEPKICFMAKGHCTGPRGGWLQCFAAWTWLPQTKQLVAFPCRAVQKSSTGTDFKFSKYRVLTLLKGWVQPPSLKNRPTLCQGNDKLRFEMSAEDVS